MIGRRQQVGSAGVSPSRTRPGRNDSAFLISRPREGEAPAEPRHRSARGVSLALLFLLVALLLAPLRAVAAPVVVGYWHNWDGKATAYIPLRQVPPVYTHVNVAFALPDPSGNGTMKFLPAKQTPAEFKRDIAILQARGTRVLLSIGGGNHPIVLTSRAQAKVFVDSLARIIREYGFNGLDINLEGESLHLARGDHDFRRPATPRVVFMIEALRNLIARFDASFVLTASPETQYLTAAYKRYGETFGGYLPLLHALRDQLDFVHMQFYNSGTQLVYTGGRITDEEFIVTQGTRDFIVALTEMLVLGFPVAQKKSHYFPGFGAAKVAIGLPATPDAASGGYLKPADLRAAVHALRTGRPTYKSAYRMRKKGGHPDLAGLMTWSINWDATRNGRTQPYGFALEARHIWKPER